MLVLTRGIQETVITRGSGECRITVVWIGRNAVRLGFEADREIVILREELVEPDGDGDGRGGGR